MQYNLTEDNELGQLNSMNLNSKGNTLSHPSISKYTNNPYKATSTLSFYKKLSDTKVLGKLLTANSTDSYFFFSYLLEIKSLTYFNH